MKPIKNTEIKSALRLFEVLASLSGGQLKKPFGSETIECLPDSTDPEKIEELAATGIKVVLLSEEEMEILKSFRNQVKR